MAFWELPGPRLELLWPLGLVRMKGFEGLLGPVACLSGLQTPFATSATEERQMLRMAAVSLRWASQGPACLLARAVTSEYAGKGVLGAACGISHTSRIAERSYIASSLFNLAKKVHLCAFVFTNTYLYLPTYLHTCMYVDMCRHCMNYRKHRASSAEVGVFSEHSNLDRS